jgi:hypothetical protein
MNYSKQKQYLAIKDCSTHGLSERMHHELFSLSSSLPEVPITVGGSYF